MRLKYYMRGVGTGIIFSLFVFLVIIIPNVRLEERMKSNGASADGSGDTGRNDGLSGLLGDKGPDGNQDGSSDTPTPVYEPTPTDAPADTITPTGTAAPEGSASPTGTAAPTDTAAPTGAASPSGSASPTITPTNTPIQTPTPTTAPTGKPTSTPTPTTAPDATPIYEKNDDGSVRFTVTKGMTSEKLASSLEKLGIVDDWKALNNYIVRHGYALKIQIGTFTLKPGMSYDEITKIVTGRKN